MPKVQHRSRDARPTTPVTEPHEQPAPDRKANKGTVNTEKQEKDDADQS